MASPSARTSRLITTGLLALCFVPAAAGVFRLVELASGAEITPANARFFESPVPVVLHIVSVIVYSVLGAFQFAPGFRRTRPAWHRRAGRVLVPAGLMSALSGLWLTLFFPVLPSDVELLAGFRIVVALAMTTSIVLGFQAIRRRDIARHRAWMIRGYALGMGAGTQAAVFLPVTVVFGEQLGLSRALLLGFAWAFNAVLAEWLIRRTPATRRRTPPRGPIVADARVPAV